MPTILISGFEPFHTHKDNASIHLVQAVKETIVNGYDVVGIILPVIHLKSIETLKAAIERNKPQAVIAIGQSRRKDVSIERTAYNKDLFKIPDNAGNQADGPVIEGAPATYPSTLPFGTWPALLQRHEIPGHLSDSAGTFVCNHLFYGLQHYLRNSEILSGFVHVPMLPEQVDAEHTPCLAFEKQLIGLRLMLEDLTLKLSEVKGKR